MTGTNDLQAHIVTGRGTIHLRLFAMEETIANSMMQFKEAQHSDGQHKQQE